MAPSSIDSRPRHQRGLPPIAVTFSRQLPDDESRATDASLAELEQLLKGLGVRAAGRVAQRRREGLSYIGSGKLEELTATIAELQADHGPSNVLLAVDGELRPGQLLRLERALDIPVIDRTGVVLRIFEQQARTPIARLETEIARLEYEAPRVRETQAHDADRQGGGGRGGRGHTNVQLEKRRIRERLTTLRRELEDLASKEERQRAVRRDFLQVALVGYTNAGKSSLMRALTGSDVLVEDRLFATLGTTVRALSPPLAPPVLVSDTVGFIRNLPHALVASFRSTLAEARDASLLLLVIDAADPEWREQLLVTRHGIEAIDAGELPALLVFNKIDGVPAEARAELSREFPTSIQLSALDPADVARLRDAIAAAFDGELVPARLEVPFADGRLLGEIRNRARILRETHTEWGVVLSVRGLPADVEGWQRALPTRHAVLTAEQLIEVAGLHGLQLRPDEVILDNSGLDFLVAHARDEEGMPWVVRTPRRQEIFASTQTEAKVLDLVRRHLPVAVPSWQIHEPELIAYPRLPGEPAYRVDPEAGLQWTGVDPAAPADGFLDSVARALAALQGISREQAEVAGLPVRGNDEVRVSIARAIDETRAELSPPKQLLARWQRWLDDDGSWPDYLALVHGDLHPGHMLLDGEGRLVGILDWTEAQLTDPSVDFALFYGCFGRTSLERLVQRFEANGGRTWQRLVEHSIERWAVFPVLAASWAIGSGNQTALEFARAQITASAG